MHGIQRGLVLQHQAGDAVVRRDCKVDRDLIAVLHLPLLIVAQMHFVVVSLPHIGEDGLVVERERLRAGELEPAALGVADLAA